jgi:enoyl reductase-like protein
MYLLYEINDQLRVMQATSPDKIIRFETTCRHMKDHTFDNIDTIANFLSKYSAISRFNRIVVSVCAGMAETELHSEEMCICLDVDKWSFYSSHFALKFLLSKRATT